MDPSVIDVMERSMRMHYANPSSTVHSAGVNAFNAVESARTIIAKAIGARTTEILFCSGSTEANNLALIGTLPLLKSKGKNHIITTSIEHPSVLEPLNYLQSSHSVRVTYLPVDETGRINPSDIEEAITENTGLISVMSANNETGIYQPLEEVGQICTNRNVLFHSDYSQATAFRPLDVIKLGLHLVSISGHKMYGPKGIGVLYRRLRKPHVKLSAILHGGGQELGLRSGTLNTPAIIAFGEAFKLVSKHQAKDNMQLLALRAKLLEKLTSIPGLRVNGDISFSLPNTLSISVQGIEPLALTRILRDKLIFSASSACSTEKVETSYVLQAMFGDTHRARTGFRLGFGRGTSETDIDNTAKVLADGIAKLRSGQIG